MAKILVVDDDPDALQGLCKLFRQQGHTVTPAIDATIALNILEKSAGDIELVATDVCMPGMNGIELGRRFLDCTRASPLSISRRMTGNRSLKWACICPTIYRFFRNHLTDSLCVD